jgi:hypothetical protein
MRDRRTLLQPRIGVLCLLLLASSCSKSKSEVTVQCDPTAYPASVGGEWVLEGDGERKSCSDPSLNGPFHLGPAHVQIREDDPNRQPQTDAGSDLDGGLDGGVSDAGRLDGHLEAGAGDGGLDAEVDGSAEGDGGSTDGPPDAVIADAAIEDGALDGDDGATSDAFGSDAGADAADGAADAGKSDAAVDAAVWVPATLRLESAIRGFQLAGDVEGACVSVATTEQLPEGGSVTYTFSGAYQSSQRGLKGNFTSAGPGACVGRGTFTAALR